MAFMEVYVTDKVEWVELEDRTGSISVFPADILTPVEYKAAQQGRCKILEKYQSESIGRPVRCRLIEGYGVHLSASGYLDQTDWEVFSTKREMEKRANELESELEEEEEDE